jgi:hypothetical protein
VVEFVVVGFAEVEPVEIVQTLKKWAVIQKKIVEH